MSTLPLLIKTTLDCLSAFVNSHSVRYGRPGLNNRAMRSDYAANFLKVLTVMVKGCCLQQGGLICNIQNDWARPETVAEMASLVGCCDKTVSRVIWDLTAMGYLESRQIKRKNTKTGQLEVSASLRRFTKKFWKALGLWGLFKSSVAWAKENGRRKLLLPFKTVSLKIKTTTVRAGNLVKSFLAGLDDAARVKFHCDQIRKTIRQNK